MAQGDLSVLELGLDQFTSTGALGSQDRFLVFSQPPDTDHPGALVFGDDGTVVPPRFADASYDLGNTLSVSAFLYKQGLLDIVVDLGNTLTVTSNAMYDNRVTRYREVSRGSGDWQPATPKTLWDDGVWGLSESKRGGTDLPHGTATRYTLGSTAGYDRSTPMENDYAGVHQLGSRTGQSSSLVHQKGTFTFNQQTGFWQPGSRADQFSVLWHQRGTFKEADWISYWNESARRHLSNQGPMGTGTSTGSLWFVGRWQDAHAAYASFYTPVEPPVVPPDKVWSPDLVFQCPVLTVPLYMVYGENQCYNPHIDPPVFVERTVYKIMNSMQLKRVSDNTQIAVDSVSVSTDRSSWAWRLTASLPYSELNKIEPSISGAVEVELDLNGIKWRFLVESYSDQKSFGKSGLSVEGRSVTAYLDDPYAPTRSYKPSGAMNSRALAEAELTRAGLETGFTLDWDLIDPLGWLLPADTWGYTDMTPMQVIRAIAEGVGGYVNSDPLARSVKVRSAYPTAPWNWSGATADKVIPSSFLKSRSLKWEERPAWNGVYVSGENTGIIAYTKLNGTAGDLLAPMVVSPFITTTAAASERGKNIIASGGKQASVSMDMPLDATMGLIQPGTLVQVTDPIETTWKALSRGVNISASWGQGLTITQRIEVERHY